MLIRLSRPYIYSLKAELTRIDLRLTQTGYDNRQGNNPNLGFYKNTGKKGEREGEHGLTSISRGWSPLPYMPKL